MPSGDELRAPRGAIVGTTGSEPIVDAAKIASVRGDFIQFYDQEFHYVVRFLMRLGANEQDAKDATQEAFVIAWRRFAQPGNWAHITHPHGWIRKVALRKYLHRPRLVQLVSNDHEHS